MLPDSATIIQHWDSLLGSFVLLITRSAAFFALCPLLSQRIFPRPVRFAVTAASAFTCLPSVSYSFEGGFPPPGVYISLLFKEFFLGYVLGVLTWLPLHALEIAGIIIDTQRGNMEGQNYDVIFGTQTTVTGIFLSQIFSGYFFAAGGWLSVTQQLYESVSLWPVMSPMPVLDEKMAAIFLRFLGTTFFTAFILILPISGMMFIADILIIYIARIAPSLNALGLGMPVKTAIMLFLLIFYLDILYPQILLGAGTALVYLSDAVAK